MSGRLGLWARLKMGRIKMGKKRCRNGFEIYDIFFVHDRFIEILKKCISERVSKKGENIVSVGSGIDQIFIPIYPSNWSI